MTHKVELHPLAEEEFLAAYAWYSERSETAARAFLREMDHAVLRISEAPERWPKYASLTRRFLLARFPFSVIYRIAEQVVEVIAVAHHKRKPGYWRPRL
jgi:plasmid stabilization system protein ParE